MNRTFRKRGFSLMELLVVLAVISILAVLIAPAIRGTLSSYQLDSTGQTVINQLNLARQTALSRGHAVQVRFYLLPAYNSSISGTPVVYRGMQSFIESDPIQGGTSVSVTATPITKPIFFPTPVIISSVTTPAPVSPLLPATPADADVTNPLPLYNTNYKVATFHFKSDGSTDLTSTTNSLSLVLQYEKAGPNGLPANFQTTSINPLNGAVRSFRP